jgi:hypothetical protein
METLIGVVTVIGFAAFIAELEYRTFKKFLIGR